MSPRLSRELPGRYALEHTVRCPCRRPVLLVHLLTARYNPTRVDPDPAPGEDRVVVTDAAVCTDERCRGGHPCGRPIAATHPSGIYRLHHCPATDWCRPPQPATTQGMEYDDHATTPL